MIRELTEEQKQRRTGGRWTDIGWVWINKIAEGFQWAIEPRAHTNGGLTILGGVVATEAEAFNATAELAVPIV